MPALTRRVGPLGAGHGPICAGAGGAQVPALAVRRTATQTTAPGSFLTACMHECQGRQDLAHTGCIAGHCAPERELLLHLSHVIPAAGSPPIRAGRYVCRAMCLDSPPVRSHQWHSKGETFACAKWRGACCRLMRFELDVLYELHYQMITLGKASPPSLVFAVPLSLFAPLRLQQTERYSACQVPSRQSSISLSDLIHCLKCVLITDGLYVCVIILDALYDKSHCALGTLGLTDSGSMSQVFGPSCPQSN